MPSEIVITNANRHYNYTLILNEQAVKEIPLSETITVEIAPGKYELSFQESSEADLQSTCMSILVTIAHGKRLPLKVLTRNLSIQIYDRKDTLLNGKTGFLCGRIGDGIRIENPHNQLYPEKM